VNEIDVDSTKLEIDKFAAANRDYIRMNADRLVNAERVFFIQPSFLQDSIINSNCLSFFFVISLMSPERHFTKKRCNRRNDRTYAKPI